jgi:hypothetical protein
MALGSVVVATRGSLANQKEPHDNDGGIGNGRNMKLRANLIDEGTQGQDGQLLSEVHRWLLRGATPPANIARTRPNERMRLYEYNRAWGDV